MRRTLDAKSSALSGGGPLPSGEAAKRLCLIWCRRNANVLQ